MRGKWFVEVIVRIFLLKKNALFTLHHVVNAFVGGDVKFNSYEESYEENAEQME